VIAGSNGTPQSLDAVVAGALLAHTVRCELLVVRVLSPGEPPDNAETKLDDEAADIARVLEGQPTETRVTTSSSPSEGLAAIAAEQDALAVIVGSTQRVGLAALVPGTTADRLLQVAQRPVGVVPRGYAGAAPPDVRVVAAAFDGSREAEAAVHLGATVARDAEGTIRVVAVAPQPAAAGEARDRAGQALGEALATLVAGLPREVRPDGVLLHGEVGAVLLGEAEKGVDFLFMGSHVWGPVHRALLGSVSATVRASSPCPVVIVPRGAGLSSRQ
jgi:nucleotide-binding universal stress UspA family protein